MPEPLHTAKKHAHIKKVAAEPMQFRAEAKELIEENWKLLSERRKDLFNSTLLRVVDFAENDDHVVIESAADVMYKDVTGMRYASGSTPREIDKADLFKVLSAYLFVITADDKLIFIERDSGDWNKALDLPGGFVQDKFNITNLEDFARKRTIDDLSISPEHIESAECIGLFDFKEILELMAIYKVKLTLPLAELRAVASITIYEVPLEYTTDTHGSHFSMQLHHPCRHVLECFLKKVKA